MLLSNETVHTHIRTPTAESTMQADNQRVGSSQGEVSHPDSSHLDTQLGGARDRTSNLPVTKTCSTQHNIQLNSWF